MTILFGVLLYVLCIAWFCALTGVNRLDDSEPLPRHARASARSQVATRASGVPAPEVNG